MARPQITYLTPVHERILTKLMQLTKEGMTASIVDLVSALHLAGETSLGPTLKVMERNGFVKVIGGGGHGKRRTVILTAKGKMATGVGGVPVLGSVPAGPLSEVIQQNEAAINLGEMLPYQSGDFLLVVNGRSMIGDGILPGDKVLLRPNVKVQNGEIAAVHYGDQYLATLKRVYFDEHEQRVTLKASNNEFEDIIVSGQDLKIVGVYRGLIRTV